MPGATSTQKPREIILGTHLRSVATSLRRGHPWVWREAIGRGLNGVAPGEEVEVLASDNDPIGRGLADPSSPIAVRLWTQGRRPLDETVWRDRAHHAVMLRGRLIDDKDCTAYRLVNGEGDRMPGFVVDRYGPVAVARTDGDGARARLGDLVAALGPLLDAIGVRSLVHRTGRKGEVPQLEHLRGEEAPDTVTVRECGVPFVVDLARGQKTGAFLDQRENRRRVGELARGRRVLNLFSYTGGFSLHAALGGAARVTSVDIATGAHATAQESFRAAGVDPAGHAFVTAEARAFLESARSRGDTWDLVISDPPSFAPSEKALPRALAAYRALHRACVEVLAPDGIFCAASCSSHVDAEAFLGTLDDSVLAGRALSILELRGAGPDHPMLAAFPEGRYLKFAILA
jgi:23S rRNA (cytosine1962-C5)-methyltransferase